VLVKFNDVFSLNLTKPLINIRFTKESGYQIPCTEEVAGSSPVRSTKTLIISRIIVILGLKNSHLPPPLEKRRQ